MNAASLALLTGLSTFGLLAAIALRVAESARRLQHVVARVVDTDLADAFIFIDPRALLQGSAVTAIVFAMVAYAFDLSVLATLALVAVLLAGPRLALRAFRSRRQRILLNQLPDAIQALAALLRAGHSLAQATATLAETQPRPLQDEWRLVLRRLRMGDRADAAFGSLASRLGAPEARLFVTTVRIALELGGSLAEALEHLADATRRRLEMQRRIAALTSQGRLQGLIVGALPLLLMLVLGAMDAQAMRLLWTRPGGWAALAVLACLEICGFVMIRRIVRIDI
jgi:tight adherence protein B